MDCSPPGSSVHGIFPGKSSGMGWHLLSSGSYQPRDRTLVPCIFCIRRRILYHWATWEAVHSFDYVLKRYPNPNLMSPPPPSMEPHPTHLRKCPSPFLWSLGEGWHETCASAYSVSPRGAQAWPWEQRRLGPILRLPQGEGAFPWHLAMWDARTLWGGGGDRWSWRRQKAGRGVWRWPGPWGSPCPSLASVSLIKGQNVNQWEYPAREDRGLASEDLQKRFKGSSPEPGSVLNPPTLGPLWCLFSRGKWGSRRRGLPKERARTPAHAAPGFYSPLGDSVANLPLSSSPHLDLKALSPLDPQSHLGSYCRWANWGSERMSDSPKVTEGEWGPGLAISCPKARPSVKSLTSIPPAGAV